jgi:hypothetical protein
MAAASNDVTVTRPARQTVFDTAQLFVHAGLSDAQTDGNRDRRYVFQQRPCVKAYKSGRIRCSMLREMKNAHTNLVGKP